MQKLYELKFTTYPRSDCEFLLENQFADAEKILTNLENLPVNKCRCKNKKSGVE